jgi:membrane protein
MLKSRLESVKIPILNHISLYKILEIYVQGLAKGALGVRAATASWYIFVSIFPFLIFFLTFISYLPYYKELQQLIYDFLLVKLLPPNIFEQVHSYMDDRIVLVNHHINSSNTFLFIISTLMFLYSSAKGVNFLIKGFKSVNNHEPIEHKGIRAIFLDIFIVLFFSVFLFVALILVYVTEIIFRFFQDSFSFDTDSFRLIINTFNFVLSFVIFFIGLCFLYYFGRTARLSFRGVMLGALLTTFLFSITTYFFGYFMANFTRYNVLYGSIGSVIIIMIWINLSVTFTLIGYELNIALKKAKSENK